MNYVPNGSSSLLFKASEHGQREVVRYLIEAVARAIIHPVTKYSPLYIAGILITESDIFGYVIGVFLRGFFRRGRIYSKMCPNE